jgi:hypothetical protein
MRFFGRHGWGKSLGETRTTESQSLKGQGDSPTVNAPQSIAQPISASLREVLVPMQRDLIVIAQEARDLDIRPFEEMAAPDLPNELVPHATSLLKRGLDLARRLFDECDGWSEEATVPGGDVRAPTLERDFEFRIENLIGDIDECQKSDDKIEAIADLAFVAKAELKHRLERIDALDPDDTRWRIIVECDSAIRRVFKSLCALELTICEATGEALQLNYESELEISLATRREYTRLRRGIVGSAEPTEETILARLRGAGTQIAMLIGRDIYPKLRVRDRSELRNLQERILSWLREESGDPRSGLRLWQDLIGAVDIFAQVSRRQELVEHDRGLVLDALEAMNLPGTTLPETIRAQLSRLLGLDDEIDELVKNEDWQVARWSQCLERLRPRLGIHDAPQEAAEPSGDFF